MTQAWLKELLLEETDTYQALRAEAALATEYTMGARKSSSFLLPWAILLKVNVDAGC